jgi:hypothetical protein
MNVAMMMGFFRTTPWRWYVDRRKRICCLVSRRSCGSSLMIDVRAAGGQGFLESVLVFVQRY